MVDGGNGEEVEIEDAGSAVEAVEMAVRAPEPGCPTMLFEVDDYMPQGYRYSKLH